MWDKIKHAFAVDSSQKTEPTAEQLELVNKLCQTIHRRGLTPAAVAFLEMARPLNYLGAQGMHFLEPIATTLFSKSQYRSLSLFLERRDAVDIICDQLESLNLGPESPNSGKDGEDILASTADEAD